MDRNKKVILFLTTLLALLAIIGTIVVCVKNLPHNTRERIVKPLANVQTITKGNNKAAKLIEGNNAFMGLLELGPKAKVPTHKDVTEEYLYVLKGGGTISINDKSFHIKEGTTVYMPPYAEVSYTNGDASTRLLQVFSGPEPAAKYKSWTKESFDWENQE